MNSVELQSNIRNTRQINHRELFLDIMLLKTESLLVHEEIIPIRFNDLMKRIEHDGFQSTPVLVDRNTLAVLDGMHRTAVMKALGAQFICVCLLDYFNPSIKIQRWCRVILGSFTEETAESLLEPIGFSLEPFEDLDRLNDVKGVLLRFRETAYKLVSDDDLVETFRKSYELELKLLEKGYDVRYCNESEANRYLESGRYETVLYPPKLEKQQVLDAVTSGKVFPPKATRHTIPARLVAVNVPLSLLKNKEISLEEANMSLVEMINIKEVKRYQVGTLDGQNIR